VTEAAWLRSKDLWAMFSHLGPNRSERKSRLFAAACCRRVWPLLDEDHRLAVEVAERFADGLADNEERAVVACLVDGAGDELDHEVIKSPRYSAAVAASWVIQSDGDAEEEGTIDLDSECCATLAAEAVVRATRSKKPEATFQADLLRDIFGNPFRPVATNPRWRSETVVALASGIYAERAFDRMPILADALEEAGCDHADILAHCRGDGPHVRGCWVVDLVLGKS
jgi:hypothetical protein